MTTTIQTTLTTIVAEYANVELSNKSIRKLKVATQIAKKYTVCNIYIQGLIFTVRYFPREESIKYSFHKEGVKGCTTGFYYDNDGILYIEDITLIKK